MPHVASTSTPSTIVDCRTRRLHLLALPATEWRFPLLKSRPKPNTHRLCVRVLASVSASVWIRDPRHITRCPGPGHPFPHCHPHILICQPPPPRPPPPFLATSSVRRIYPRCGQRHVTWIESVIVSCADAVVRMPHLPGRLVASPHVPPIRLIHPSTTRSHFHFTGPCPPAVQGFVSQRQRRSLKPSSLYTYSLMAQTARYWIRMARKV